MSKGSSSNVANRRQCGNVYLGIADKILRRKGMPDKKRKALLATRNYRKIEFEVKAENLIEAAVDGAISGLGKLGIAAPFDVHQFTHYILHGGTCPGIDQVSQRLFFVAPERAVIVALCALTYLHNQWILDASSDFEKYLNQDRIYLFLPINLVGFERVRRYFNEIVDPICTAIGCQNIDISTVRRGYYDWQKHLKLFPIELEALTDHIIVIAESLYTEESPGLNKAVARALMDRDIAQRAAIHCLAENDMY